MNVRATWIAALGSLWWFVAVQAGAQGYGGLGTDAQGYAFPSPQYVMQFPKDHGPHREFRIEWWYLTANLTGDDGREYGVQWTLFRNAMIPPNAETLTTANDWSPSQLWMGHAAVTTPDAHYVSETRARSILGLAGAQSNPFKAWINDWQLAANSSDDPNFESLTVAANGEKFSYHLDMKAQGPLVFHGGNGYSVKSFAGHASHYYSQPHFKVSGSINLAGKPVKVTGTAWLDREWSSQPLSADQSGWDWVSLNLNDGSKLMGYRLRGGGDVEGGEIHVSATWISPLGTAISYPNGKLSMEEVSTSVVAGRSVPTAWRLKLPAKDIDIEIEALNKNAWMATSFPYWEGPAIIRGSHTGRGYLEMTGYE
ncbi:MAG: iron ABC transporter permease [Rhizobiaceae bacterium]|nr:iron ABC transporter permease [Rhizobiaceae bacterium]